MGNLLRSVVFVFVLSNCRKFFSKPKQTVETRSAAPLLGKLMGSSSGSQLAYIQLGVTYRLCLLLRQRLHVHVKASQLSKFGLYNDKYREVASERSNAHLMWSSEQGPLELLAKRELQRLNRSCLRVKVCLYLFNSVENEVEEFCKLLALLLNQSRGMYIPHCDAKKKKNMLLS